MENLKTSDKFRQLLMKFHRPKPPSKVEKEIETSIRKSSRKIKKLEKYDSSPFPYKAKEFKSKEDTARPKNKPQHEIRGNVRGRPPGGSNNKKPPTDNYYEAPVAGSSKKKPLDMRKMADGGDRMDGNKSRDSTEDEDEFEAPFPGPSRGTRQDLREENNRREQSSPQQSAFRVPSTSRQMSKEPSIPQARGLLRRNQDNEESYMPDLRRNRDVSMMERRRQTHEPSFSAEKRMVDTFLENRYANSRQVSSNQPRWRPNTAQVNDMYENSRHPVMTLDDIARTREPSVMYRSKLETLAGNRQPFIKLVDVMKSREREEWQHSRMAPPPPEPPKRFDGGFLRPPTPPGIAELAEKEQSSIIDAVNKFKNFTPYSTIEIIFHLNRLENSLINKMNKTTKKTHSAQSVLRATMMESTTEETVKSCMVQSWLKSNESVAPQRWAEEARSRKRSHETTADWNSKRKKRMADDEEIISYRERRDPPLNMSRSLMRRMEDARQLNSSTPINHFEDE